MDPSALIFIALAAAWAIYLIPKALEHHEESVRTRTVERFSATMRVLARREPVSRRRARLVPAGSPSTEANGRPSAPADPPPRSLDHSPVRRAAAARAARRRLRVVTLILLAIAVVAGVAAFHVIAWRWVGVPVGVLVAWLIACRVMVKRERRVARPRSRTPRRAPARPVAPRVDVDDEPADAEQTGTVPAVPAVAAPLATDGPVVSADGRPDPTDPESWDPVPVTLPTYVSKPVAPRSVRTIDLDSTGVWSSGRSESDSELVRETSRETSRDTERGEADEPAERRRHA